MLLSSYFALKRTARSSRTDGHGNPLSPIAGGSPWAADVFAALAIWIALCGSKSCVQNMNTQKIVVIADIFDMFIC